jgi:hypothetical protein
MITDTIFAALAFWADKPSDERDMWLSCPSALKLIKNVRLVHYGNY